MKVSLSWVKEYVDIDLPVDDLVKKIGAQLGGVDEVVDQSKKYKGIIIAEVVKCQKHPNADKLKVCLIDDKRTAKNVTRNKDGLVELVCGAPNVKEGMLVAWLPPGATVPVTFDKEPLVLSAREIRGVVSNGMLASAHELDLSNDHSGIAELSFGEAGGDFAKELGLDDHIIDIENKMFTHRPDCFGIYGVAREISGITGKQFKTPGRFTEEPEPPKPESDLTVSVKNNIPNLVPRFTALVIEDVKVKPVSLWIQARLSQVGIRPVNGVVDITNYTMYLMAQPLHAYDYDKLCKVAGTKTPQLETRLSKKGDKLKLLNGKTVTFDDEETVLITSNDFPVGIGGVMGGADTEVDETTTKVVLESANFDMYSIRRASMRHGLFTDAVTRFNKGQSPLQCLAALYLCAGWIKQQAMLHNAAGKIGKATDVHTKLQKPIAVHVTQKFINDRLGLKLDKKAMAKLLTNVEFDVAINGLGLEVTPPFWRTDIEIPEDVVEEIGRLYGYDHLPLELPKRDLTPPKKNPSLELKAKIRDILCAAGANELLTYSFVHGDLLDKVGQDKTKAFQISNALSPDLQYYRTGLTPSLLDKIHMNAKAGYEEFALFEFGKVHYKGEWEQDEPDVPLEDSHLALVISYSKKDHPKGAAYYQAKNYLSLIAPETTSMLVPLSSFDVSTDEWGRQLVAPYEPNRSAVIVKDGKIWGVVGEYRSSVSRALKLPDYTAGFEINLGVLGDLTQTYRQLSRYPSVTQDISLKVPSDLSYGQLSDFISQKISELKPEQATWKLMALDIYQGKDKTSLHIAFRLEIASYERTLTDQEINQLLDDVAVAAKNKFGAERL